MKMSNPAIEVGTNCYIGNQGVVQWAVVVAIQRSRVVIRWKNSARECTRTVGVCYEPDRWFATGTSGKMLPRFVCSSSQKAVLDAAPRIRNVIALLCPQAA